jgi:hypothetical protein
MFGSMYRLEDDVQNAAFMVNDLERHLHTNVNYEKHCRYLSPSTMSLGNLLATLQRLKALRSAMGEDSNVALGNIRTIYQLTRHYNIDRFVACLRSEFDTRFDLLCAFTNDIYQIRPGAPVDLEPHLRQRTLIEAMLPDVCELELIEVDEVELKLKRADVQLGKLLSANGQFRWVAEIEDAYPEDTFWWLHRQMSPDFPHEQILYL